MNEEVIEAMLALVYDAPCSLYYNAGDTLYFVVENRSLKSLSVGDDEKLYDNLVVTNKNGEIQETYNFALGSGDKLIVEMTKDSHGKAIRDKLVVYDNSMNKLTEYVNTDTKDFVLKLLNDEVRCIRCSDGTLYGLDGNILERE